MHVEHHGISYYIEFTHLQFNGPIEVKTENRGFRFITGVTECSILQGTHIKDISSIVSQGFAKCAAEDRFEKEPARQISLKRAVTPIDDRALRGKLLSAYYTRKTL